MTQQICPICDCQNKMPSIAKIALLPDMDHDLLACTDCNTAFMSPMPEHDELIKFYQGDYYQTNNQKDFENGIWFATHQLQKKQGRLLDIGCHTGHFIAGIDSASEWDVVGTDISEDVVNYVKEQHQLEAYSGELHSLKLDAASFDAIRVQDVLEHVCDPKAFLQECHRLLKPAGDIFLSVPNGETDRLPIRRYYQKFQRAALTPPGHLFYFSKQAINDLTQQCGFSITSMHSYHFRSGFRNHGWLPQKKSWVQSYTPKNKENKQSKPLNMAQINKNASQGLRQYWRRIRENFYTLPGWQKYALDIQIHLRKAG